MRLSYRTLQLTLHEPFATHKEVKPARVPNILVTLEWEGLRGEGIAVPAKDYGMSDASLVAALDRFSPVLARSSPFTVEQTVAELVELAGDQPSAVAAVDMALHDLLGKAAKLPLFKLLGLGGLPLAATGLTLGLMTADAAREKAHRLSAWPLLKLKLGQVPDFAAVEAVRAVYAGTIAVDGNGAWSADEALRVAERLARSSVALLEQPVAPGAVEQLRYVRERSPIPIVADEDCTGPESVVRLAGCVDGVNIKLLKAGGLRRAMRMILLARSLGMKVMLGCKIESTLSITAMGHLAGLADWSDLNGHLLVADDPFQGMQLEAGRMTLPEAVPGLGVHALAGR
ncbi:dipeptide epimerase [Corallococcus sp. RDP092CA]|uniref:dipeptide epimerase n=1 Tax=Corallococcus sp. RDP092CA TaxID=3109369 RepID=UPI0035B4EA55